MNIFAKSSILSLPQLIHDGSRLWADVCEDFIDNFQHYLLGKYDISAVFRP